MTNRFVVRGLAALVLAAFAGAASAGGFECPQMQPAGGPGVIKETPQQIDALAPVLAGGDVAAQIPAIVAGLKQRYPTAQSAEIANYLITAYCPGVAKLADLDDAQKTARVQGFSKTVLGVLY